MSEPKKQPHLEQLLDSLDKELAKTHITYKNPHKLIAISKLKQLAKEASWISFLLEDGGRVAAGSRIPKFIKKLNRLTRYAVKHGLLENTPKLTYVKTWVHDEPLTDTFTPGNSDNYLVHKLVNALEGEENSDRLLASLLISWAKQTTPAIAPEHAQP